MLVEIATQIALPVMIVAICLMLYVVVSEIVWALRCLRVSVKWEDEPGAEQTEQAKSLYSLYKVSQPPEDGIAQLEYFCDIEYSGRDADGRGYEFIAEITQEQNRELHELLRLERAGGLYWVVRSTDAAPWPSLESPMDLFSLRLKSKPCCDKGKLVMILVMRMLLTGDVDAA